MTIHDEELRRRISDLERWKQQIEVIRAREDENFKHVDKRFDRIERDLTEIKDAFKKGMWVVAAMVIAAFVTFIMKGGLNV